MYKKNKLIIAIYLYICMMSVGVLYAEPFRINPGSSARTVAENLKNDGFIGYPKMFILILRISGKSKQIKAGMYDIPKDAGYLKIIKILVSGKQRYEKVTIPEGFTTEQIAERLFSKNIIDDPQGFIRMIETANKRGFLYPETYYFTGYEKPEQIMNIMVEEFYKNVGSQEMARIKELGYNLNEIVILASLVEKEAKVAEERPIIADIFYRRLKKRKYLESCASVLFALGGHKKKLMYKDLEIDSPYNTYRHFGLPPTPICNPGKPSIIAALYPQANSFMYFFARGDGSHEFSEKYSEHLKKQKNL